MLIFDVEATHYLPVPSCPVLRLYQTCFRCVITYICTIFIFYKYLHHTCFRCVITNIFRLFIHNSLSESILMGFRPSGFRTGSKRGSFLMVPRVCTSCGGGFDLFHCHHLHRDRHHHHHRNHHHQHHRNCHHHHHPQYHYNIIIRH